MNFKKLISPAPLPFDYDEWQKKSFNERVLMLCKAWAIQGYGAPVAVYIFYILKIFIYILVWLGFCSLPSNLGSWSTIEQWWFKPEAIGKAMAWSMLFEVLGFGCGSGPLTARYFPPFGAFLHFFRPKTIKQPLFPKLIKSNTRNWLDVILFSVYTISIVRLLIAPEINTSLILPIIITLPILTLFDKTIFIASRGEHYFIGLFCFLFPLSTIAGLKLVWVAIWIWAATSKLNRHFPSVIGVMVSNSAILRGTWFRKKMYINYPDDLRASKLSASLAHLGTLVEFIFPLVLLFSDGGTLTQTTLVIMFIFHLYITSSIPMAVPLEWNIIMVYGGFVLFGNHHNFNTLDINNIYLSIALFISLLLLPLFGNLFPKHISFLVSMRYYAGNWPYSIWLFKKGKEEELDKHIVKSAKTVEKQLQYFYDEATAKSLIAKIIAFRSMHLHGRILQRVVPKMVNNIDDYIWREGELIAGVCLGWNFGDGHIHNEQLLEAIQQRCNFESGDLRCLFVEAQPVFNPSIHWRIVDAKDGELENGYSIVKELEQLQPWCSIEQT